jgi:hypothetical protein
MPSHPTDRPLTLKQYSEERKLPLDYLVKTWGLKDVQRGGVCCVEQPYTRMDGEAYAPRYRYANAKKSPFKSGDRIILYGQKQLINSDSDMVALVEGESDTQTLHYARYTVLGIPGTSMWDTCISNDPHIETFLAGKTVIVIQEPPSPKEKAKKLDSPASLLAKIKASLPLSKVVAVRLWEFAPRDSDGEPLYKDVSGLWMYYDGLRGFKQFMNALHIASRAAAKRESGTRKIQAVLASDVEMALTRWLWYEHIPVGGVTVFAGMPAKGKSTAAIDVVARLTTGRDFPDSVKQVEPCEAAILASEDDEKTTTVPRLHAAKADVSKVRLLQGTSDGTQLWEIALDQDLERLREFLREHSQVKLIVIDPVTSYIGDVDPNKPKEVRPFLNKLKKFADEMGVSLLLIMHLSKNPDVSALHRVGGAATWIEVPRSVWFFDMKQQDDDEESSKGSEPPSYVMVNGKLNIVADARKKSLEFTFAGMEVPIPDENSNPVLQSVGTIHWGKESSITLEQQYGHSGRNKPGMKPEKTQQAMAWLRDFLSDGPRPSESNDGVFAKGEAAGHKRDTLYEAKKRLGVKAKKTNGGYVWLVPEVPEVQEEPQESEVPEASAV